MLSCVGTLKIHVFSAQLMHIHYRFQNWFHTGYAPLSLSPRAVRVCTGLCDETCLRRAISATPYNGAESASSVCCMACACIVHALQHSIVQDRSLAFPKKWPTTQARLPKPRRNYASQPISKLAASLRSRTGVMAWKR